MPTAIKKNSQCLQLIYQVVSSQAETWRVSFLMIASERETRVAVLLDILLILTIYQFYLKLLYKSYWALNYSTKVENEIFIWEVTGYNWSTFKADFLGATFWSKTAIHNIGIGQ